MENDEDSWRKTLCTGILFVNTWSVFMIFRQISLVANTAQVPNELLKNMSQSEFEVFRKVAVIGLIMKIFEHLRVTVIMITRIFRGYPAWIWRLTSQYDHILSNRVVCYTVIETIMANWLAVVLVNIGLLLNGDWIGVIFFNAAVAFVIVMSATLTYLLVIATKLFGPAFFLYAAVPLNMIEVLHIILVIQYVIPHYCHSLPRSAAVVLHPTAEKVNFPVSNICMIPDRNNQYGANAAFIGIWGYKMIIITESLLKAVGLTDARGVLAHELGHWIGGHVLALVASHLFQTVVSSFVLALCYGSQLVFRVFGFNDADSPHPAIGVLIGLQYLVPLIGSISQGFTTILTYFNEYKADHFAVDLGLGIGLKNALITLVGSMKRFPLFDSWFAAWFIGHPDVLDRVHKVLEDIK